MNIKGQAFIEVVFVLPILIALWGAILWFSQVLIVSIELLHTARHGVFWLAYQDPAALSRAKETREVQEECLRFLKHQAPGLDPRRIRITIDPGDTWKPAGPKTLVDLPGLFKLMTRLQTTFKEASGLTPFEPASVRLEYRYPVPPLLRALPGFPAEFPLRGSCVCYR